MSIRCVALTGLRRGGMTTTTVVNLAASLAVFEQSVLLVDCAGGDAGRYFGCECGCPGLTDAPQQSSRLRELIQSTTVPYLDILPFGSRSSFPRGLFWERSPDVFRDWPYDLVLIDTCLERFPAWTASNWTALIGILGTSAFLDEQLEQWASLCTQVADVSDALPLALVVQGAEVSGLQAVLQTRIERDARLASLRRPAVLEDIGSQAAQNFLDLAREVLEYDFDAI